MTLALLITAVTGAWAQTQWESGSCTVTLNNGTLTVSGNGTMADYENISNRPWDNNSEDITSVVVESGVTSVGKRAFQSFINLTSVTLPEGLTRIGGSAFMACGRLTSVTIPSTVTSINVDAFYNCQGVTDVYLYADPANLTWNDGDCDDFKSGKATQCHVFAEHLSTYQNNFGKVNVTVVGDLKPLATSAIEVTTNAAEEGATFTEASFQMPTNDVTVDYELVRDMGYKVAFSGVPTRARLAKDGDGKFHFADGLTFQLLDNIEAATPKDITRAEGITFMVGEVEAVDIEGNTYYQLDKETLVPLADFLADAHLGNYAICAVASTGEYDGSFTSDRITLFQGYEVQVAAKEFITYYKDEPLYVEDTDVTLYTITAVSGDKATATEVTTAPAGLPLLVKNNSADREKTTVLLIPTTDRTPDTGIEVYAGFLGTLEATTILASDASTDRYALNGHEFVWVKNPVSIAANKAWLEVPTGAAAGARALTIVFSDETTGVNEVIEVNGVTDDTFYDLNGRKVAVPNKKGIYIQNGKKVVIK